MNHNKETVLGLKKLDKVFIIVLPVIIGGVLGWYIPAIADWLLTLPFIPMEGLLEKIVSFDRFLVSVIASVIGIILGFAFSWYVFYETLKIQISEQEVQLYIRNTQQVIKKGDITAVFMEQKQLVIQDLDGNESFREVSDIEVERVEEAFREHGYPWCDEDPYLHEFRKWELGNSVFPSEINSILYERLKAIREDEEKQANLLKQDLNKLGVVVKDRKTEQYVRMVKPNN
ncbi:hypothetical protein KM914_17730 [Virgibacillus pantothenticus]|uniref:YqeB family protein n=1 Tax=Virgibacillus pantothenticus TaxID=1473 RepID=UPI001C2121A1|nr:hypothetical protein [Virgibacillus pantothenticus]MBU8568226.1 hypothetical protein [Virgibacillus pantothenticus]MBU8601848.1 hypothetical protein [Virgibacillus pantothenticus]MBU8636059.1 hypothetical protein [Virgibacillus pantothenticus]MBU8644138.1 hypothetical protein [Virgibacillus pantothenticus]MBU8647910.1 hypothetical protein [Virgibacillus pantothenticus]